MIPARRIGNVDVRFAFRLASSSVQHDAMKKILIRFFPQRRTIPRAVGSVLLLPTLVFVRRFFSSRAHSFGRTGALSRRKKKEKKNNVEGFSMARLSINDGQNARRLSVHR